MPAGGDSSPPRIEPKTNPSADICRPPRQLPNVLAFCCGRRDSEDERPANRETQSAGGPQDPAEPPLPICRNALLCRS